MWGYNGTTNGSSTIVTGNKQVVGTYISPTYGSSISTLNNITMPAQFTYVSGGGPSGALYTYVYNGTTYNLNIMPAI